MTKNTQHLHLEIHETKNAFYSRLPDNKHSRLPDNKHIAKCKIQDTLFTVGWQAITTPQNTKYRNFYLRLTHRKWKHQKYYTRNFIHSGLSNNKQGKNTRNFIYSRLSDNKQTAIHKIQESLLIAGFQTIHTPRMKDTRNLIQSRLQTINTPKIQDIRDFIHRWLSDNKNIAKWRLQETVFPVCFQKINIL